MRMGMRRLQIRFADDFADGMAELFEADQGFAAGARSGIGEDLEGAGGEFDPVVRRV